MLLPLPIFVTFLIFFHCYYSVRQAGPGTIAEALIRGLPIILNDFIPGQVCDYYIVHSFTHRMCFGV
jgi:hypothetical protein